LGVLRAPGCPDVAGVATPVTPTGNLEQAVSFQAEVATSVWSSSPRTNSTSWSGYKSKCELWIISLERLPTEYQQREAILPDWSFEDFDAKYSTGGNEQYHYNNEDIFEELLVDVVMGEEDDVRRTLRHLPLFRQQSYYIHNLGSKYIALITSKVFPTSYYYLGAGGARCLCNGY